MLRNTTDKVVGLNAVQLLLSGKITKKFISTEPVFSQQIMPTPKCHCYVSYPRSHQVNVYLQSYNALRKCQTCIKLSIKFLRRQIASF